MLIWTQKNRHVEFLSILEAILVAADLVAFIADVYSWIRGRQNRIERRVARSSGDEVPARDQWNRRVIVLTVIISIITAILISRKL
jgi:hypothetical protein